MQSTITMYFSFSVYNAFLSITPAFLPLLPLALALARYLPLLSLRPGVRHLCHTLTYRFSRSKLSSHTKREALCIFFRFLSFLSFAFHFSRSSSVILQVLTQTWYLVVLFIAQTCMVYNKLLQQKSWSST